MPTRTSDEEREDLHLHVALCDQRYQTLTDVAEQVGKSISKIEARLVKIEYAAVCALCAVILQLIAVIFFVLDK